jgi:predicted CoA-binding protein
MQMRGIRVIPVNPTIASALGHRSYPDLASVPVRFDTVQVFRRSDAVGGVAREILALPADRRPRVVWMQSGIADPRAARDLSAAGIEVVMDRCLSVDMARYRP